MRTKEEAEKYLNIHEMWQGGRRRKKTASKRNEGKRMFNELVVRDRI